MRMIAGRHIALHAPNIMAVCVDHEQNGEFSGNVYHCYDENPWPFANVMQLIERMEELYDRISFPQASAKSRTLVDVQKQEKKPLTKKVEAKQVAQYRGQAGTFLLYVRYRQNSSWQGEVEWVEGNELVAFSSELELLKIMNNQLRKR